MSKNKIFIILWVIYFLLFGNHSAYADDDEFAEFESAIVKGSIHDPFENYNRKIYKFNDTIDKYFFEHLARSYRKTIPKPARLSFRNDFTTFDNKLYCSR